LSNNPSDATWDGGDQLSSFQWSNLVSAGTHTVSINAWGSGLNDWDGSPLNLTVIALGG